MCDGRRREETTKNVGTPDDPEHALIRVTRDGMLLASS